MKKKILFSVVVCLLLTFTVLFHADKTFAKPESGAALSVSVGQAVADQSVSLSAGAATVVSGGTRIRVIETNGTAPLYQSPVYTSSTTINYKIAMPKAGAFYVAYAGANGSAYVSFKNASGTSVSPSSTNSKNNVTEKYFLCGAGTHTLSFNLYPSSSGSRAAVVFSLAYIASGKTIPADGSERYCGHAANNGLSTFKINVPSSGYLKLAMGDASGGSYKSNINVKTKGFTDYESLSTSDNVRFIGVKKGTYTFTVKTSAPVYAIKASFTKVKESKYGKKKSKAVSLKKKKTVKGLLPAGKAKAHWYKFKLKKNQKVTLNFKTSLCGAGSYVGGLKYTLYASYDTGTGTIYSGLRTTPYKPYTIGMSPKLKKGTYYLKIESYKKGTGYYTIKWK